MLAQWLRENKSPKGRKRTKMLASQESILNGNKGQRRPFSSDDMIDNYVLNLSKSKANTYSGSAASFSYYTSTATCYHCLYDAAKGRQFCEIMGSKYCYKCIRITRRDLHRGLNSCTLGISDDTGKTSFNDAVINRIQCPTTAIPNTRNCFLRLHNMNLMSEYYINPMDDIRTNSSLPPRKLAFDNATPLNVVKQKAQEVYQESAYGAFLQVCDTDPGSLQKKDWTSKRKKRITGTVHTERKKVVTFNGLPLEPPLITIDLSNQIMNHLTVKDIWQFVGKAWSSGWLRSWAGRPFSVSDSLTNWASN